MTREDFNSFCATLPAANHVVQWGNADVWKAGPKVFAICGRAGGRDAFTFKVGDIAFEVLSDSPGIRPAPYLAARGMKWVQVYRDGALSDAALRAHVADSHALVVAGMTRRLRAQLGL